MLQHLQRPSKKKRQTFIFSLCVSLPSPAAISQIRISPNLEKEKEAHVRESGS